MIGCFMSDRGKVREHNEDAGGIFFNQTGQVLTVIADGMGGHKAGDVASQMAVDLVQKNWEETHAFEHCEEIEQWLHETIQTINTNVYEYAEAHDECFGMGTTIVVTVCLADSVVIGHIGDSRCYKQTSDSFEQLTDDHSLVNELVKAGEITKEEARQHPRNNVLLKALGTKPFNEPDVQTVEWNEKNKLIMCTDGLTDKLPDDQLEQTFQEKESLTAIGQHLIDQALDTGGEDNISVLLIEHDGKEEGVVL